MTTHTVDTLMALAYKIRDARTYEWDVSEVVEAGNALRAALTKSLGYSDVTLIDEGDIVHPMRRELRPWEKALLGPPHPKDFGIPKGHWEAAQYYANFWHQNQLKATEVLK
jgi:hypothetical protein